MGRGAGGAGRRIGVCGGMAGRSAGEAVGTAAAADLAGVPLDERRKRAARRTGIPGVGGRDGEEPCGGGGDGRRRGEAGWFRAGDHGGIAGSDGAGDGADAGDWRAVARDRRG